MNVRYVRLIEEGEEDLWNREKDFSRLFGQVWLHNGGASHGPVEHLRYIRERRGEKIIALDEDSQTLLGWIAVFPDRDVGGPVYSLAGIEVHADHRGRGIGVGLMEAVRVYGEEKKVHRLKFGTSPLLTRCARLYVTRFGARYRWKQGVKSPTGRPWPCVSCECDFDDPLAKPLDLRDDEIEARSVLDWEGTRPVPRSGMMYSGPLSVTLPELTANGLADAVTGVPRFLEILYAVFDTLFVHGYGFAWFDRVAEAGGPARCYYVMKRVMPI
jgi:GNAT superfamily N-acetyltransferase